MKKLFKATFKQDFTGVKIFKVRKYDNGDIICTFSFNYDSKKSLHTAQIGNFNEEQEIKEYFNVS